MTNLGDAGIFDVSQPGQSATDPTSRPIISGRGQILKDPMVSDRPAKASLAVAPAKVINPLGGSSAGSLGHPSASGVETESLRKPEPATMPDPAPVPGMTGHATASSKDVDAAYVGSSQAELVRSQRLEDLVQAGTYFLPIGQTARRRGWRGIAVVVGLATLVLVGYYLALAAGLI